MGRTNRAARAARTVTTEDGLEVTRLFHPSADTFYDVPADRVDEWLEQGWTSDPGEKNRPETYPALVDYADPDKPRVVEGIGSVLDDDGAPVVPNDGSE